jgi:hypothetical protein
MKTRASFAAGWKLTWLAVLLALVLSAGVGQAAQRLTIPDQYSNLPYYARILRFVGYTDTVAVVFYRPPEWVPDDFNLHLFYDFNVDPTCPLLVEGSATWEGEPGVGVPPFQMTLHEVEGTPVPIWFLDDAEVLAAYLSDRDGDGQPDYVITVPDLEVMPSLQRAWADSYEEQVHPTGGAQVPSINIVTSGMVEDGRSFFMLWERANTDFLTETILRFSD